MNVYRKHVLAVTVICLFFCPFENLLGQEEGGHAVAMIAEQASESVEGLFNDLKTAINKGEYSQVGVLAGKLALHYAFPAVGALLFLIVCYFTASFIARLVGSKFSRKVDLTLGRFLTKVIRISLMVMAVLGVLGTFGVNVTSFAALLAAVGFAVGMALQGTLSNFAAGIMLIVFRPFKVDDYIKVDGGEGIVEEIELFTTRINTLDNRHIIVPNGEIFGNTIENYSRNSVRRVDVCVGTDYESDLKTTRQVLQGIVENVEGMESDPKPQVVMCELGASSIDWELRVWCHPDNYWAVREALVQKTKLDLDEAGIGIPYPQMDVNVAGRIHAKSVDVNERRSAGAMRDVA